MRGDSSVALTTRVCREVGFELDVALVSSDDTPSSVCTSRSRVRSCVQRRSDELARERVLARRCCELPASELVRWLQRVSCVPVSARVPRARRVPDCARVPRVDELRDRVRATRPVLSHERRQDLGLRDIRS